MESSVGPIHSLIIPVKNVSPLFDTIYEHISSLNTSIEIIFVANGKGVVEWAKDKPNLTIVTELRQGPSSARNAGAREANGKYLTFMDADVLIEKEWFSYIEGRFKRLPWNSAISGKLTPQMLDNQCLYNYRKNLLDLLTNKKGNLLYSAKVFPVMDSALFAIRKDVFSLVGGFNENLNHMEDTEFTIKILRHGYHIEVCNFSAGQIFTESDSFIKDAIRSFKKGLGLSALIKETGMNHYSTFRDHPFFLPWPHKRKLHFKFSCFLMLLGQAISLNLGKENNRKQHINLGNIKNYFFFRFYDQDKSFHLCPRASFVIFPEKIHFYHFGNFRREGSNDEKETLLNLVTNQNDIPSDYKKSWIKEGLFIPLNKPHH